ncbi:MAG TPA: M28 family peptidase [Chthoniobacterales bacterium]
MKKLLLFAFVCSSAFAADNPALPPKAALDSITPDGLLKHIKVLASDEFEGRAPGSKGEELSIKYIADQFKAVGLKPGNPDGTYLQEVPLAGITTEPTAHFSVNGNTVDLKFPDDYVASSARLQDNINVSDSPIVFVGYGIVAPEFGWDDYKDVDVKGKTILMLINDPPVVDPNTGELDRKMFGGRAMTYYGRWTYKYEIAAQKGAAAAVIIHETEPAAYPYSVVRTSWSKENFEIDRPNKNMDQVEVRSWITLDIAKKFLADSGQDFDALKQAAVTKGFRPVELNGATATFDIKQQVRSFKSHNVVGKIDGSDAKLKDEWVIYSAHWDHLGKHSELQGDQIFNGAVDNASGVAAVIELAKAYTKLPKPTKRSVLFMSTTAEEAGLLGAKYYAEHPLYPLEKTLADINIDELNVWGKARDIEETSFGFTTLSDMLGEAAKTQNRTLVPNPRAEKGSIYRADNFEFSKVGVPVLYIGPIEHLLSRAADAPLRSDEFDAHDYHQVSDEVHPDWDLSGAAQDVQLLFDVGYDVANGAKWPEWKAGNEFKPKRDEMLSRAKTR